LDAARRAGGLSALQPVPTASSFAGEEVHVRARAPEVANVSSGPPPGETTASACRATAGGDVSDGSLPFADMRGGRSRTVLAIAAGALLALGAAGASVAASRGSSAAQLPHYFTISCHFSHAAPDDPIVFPGRPSRSHEHTFIGNVSTNAFSTPASLGKHGTTCNHSGDRSGYWAPTLYANGRAVQPIGATIYYRRITRAGWS
jgi:hypothetical protein